MYTKLETSGHKATYWLAAGSATKMAAARKSSTCKAKITRKMSISYFKKPEMTGDDDRKWK